MQFVEVDSRLKEEGISDELCDQQTEFKVNNNKNTRVRLFEGNAQFVQKMTFEPLIDFTQDHYGN